MYGDQFGEFVSEYQGLKDYFEGQFAWTLARWASELWQGWLARAFFLSTVEETNMNMAYASFDP